MRWSLGDSQVTVKILREEMVCPSEVEIVEDIRKMAHQFQSCVFLFVRRSTNVVVIELAREIGRVQNEHLGVLATGLVTFFY